MHKCLIIRNLMGAYWEEGALLWGALAVVLFWSCWSSKSYKQSGYRRRCSLYTHWKQGKEGWRVLIWEKQMFYIMALGVGVLIQGKVLIRVWVFIQGKEVYHECSHKPQGDLLLCKASRGCCIWPCGWELFRGGHL